MAEILRLENLIAKLRRKALKAARDSKVVGIVGYTQAYAVWVHENLQAYHPIGKAKYLIDPARALASDLGGIILDLLRRGRTMSQAIYAACLYLQRASQKEAPVDTGALRNSAFSRIEKGS